MANTVVVSQKPASSTGDMEGLCSELLLIPPPLSNLEPVERDCPPEHPTPLTSDPGCLLVKATATEEDPGSMEIIVEAVAGNETPGVLVKVVEVYFCEHCEQSFAEPTLLALHQCPEAPTQPGQAERDSPQSQSPTDDPLLCPVCGQEFVQPQALKSHFKMHRGAPNTFPCLEPGCGFSVEARRALQQHLRQVHGADVPVPCAFRGCPLLFTNQQSMECHRQAHYPFHCRLCSFVGSNIKLFRQHQRSHGVGTPRALATTLGLPGGGAPSEEASLPQPGSQTTVNHDAEKEESGPQDIPQTPESGQQAQPREGETTSSLEPLFKTHMCPECKRCFKKRTHLVEHLHLHFPDPSLQCPNCQKFFTSKSKLKTHLLRERGQKAHRCPLCPYRAVERNALNRHMASMHEGSSNLYSDTYTCPVCRAEFHLSQALKEHLKSHAAAATTTPPALSCFQAGCYYTAPDRKAFVRHLKETHGARAVECRHHACQLLFATAEDMEAHHKSHYAFHCPHCDFACSNKHLFRKHKKQGHPGSEELCCPFCSFTTFNPVAYQDHVGKMHAHEKIHQCAECSFATAHKRVLIRHMLLHTGEKPHKCELCDFTCRDVSYLSKHMLTHSDTKDYMCTECGYVTKWKHYLSVHMRKHAGDLRYQCNQCSYRCHRADQLSSHKLRHQDKTLMCEVCAFACKRKYELQKHMAAQHHPGAPAPLYKCRYCSYQSRHKQALLTHENCKHTRLREFRCTLCDYHSFSNTALFCHKRKAHGYVPGDQVWQLRYTDQEPETARQCPTPPLPDSEPSNPPYTSPEEPSGDLVPSEHASLEPTLPENSREELESHPGPAVGGSPRPAEVDEGGCTLHLEALGIEPEAVAEPPLEALAEADPTELGSLEEPRPPQAAALPQLGMEQEPLTAKPVPESPRDAPSSEEGPPGLQMGALETAPPAEMGPLAQLPEAESLLRALRRRDKEQAETLVLEGRVQMLMVRDEARAFRCPQCPFITRREKALSLHTQTGCPGRPGRGCRASLLCPECGASFKQQRGLSTHLLKKCPVLLSRNKGLPGPAMLPLPPAASATGKGETPPPAPLESKPEPPKDAPSALPKEPEEIATPLASCPLSDSSSQVPSTGIPTSPTETPKKFHFEQGKFHCAACSFLCSRLSSITSHVAQGCRAVRAKQGAPHSPASSPWSPAGNPENGTPKPKGTRFSCTKCPFSCQQERALRTHQARGCPLLAGEPCRCDLCPFTAPRAAALRLHHRRKHPTHTGSSTPPARGPRPPLQCTDCSFTCKQSRCLQQHRQLKHEGVKPHRCPFCDFSTTRRYRLEAHQSRHTGVGRIPCSSCPQTFGTNSKLRLHRLRVHDKTPTHFCPLCDYSGYLRHDITRHVNSCHQGTPTFACPQCEAHFSSETALKQHTLRRHHPESPVTTNPDAPSSPSEAAEGPLHCSRCGVQCPNPASLRGHTRKQHPRLECASCQAAFPSRPALEAHRRQQHFSHRCQLCDFAARERMGLVKHYLEQHEGRDAEDGDPPGLHCPFCDFTCRHQLVLDHHVKGHGGTRLYKCTDCAYSTKNRQKITWHSRIHTGEKPYRCHLCPYACADPSRLKYHMRIHKEERKYLCPDCGYKCKWVNQLKYHMTKHTGLKPYQCPECEYCTNRADALRVHQETRHREARAFVCEQCGKAFKTRFLLRTHLRKHSEAKPYVCNVCLRAFRWAAGLRHHALTHTDRHPFFCRLCSYKAKQKFQVVKHVRRHHPDQADPSQGVGKDPSTPTVHLHDVQLEDPGIQVPAAPPTGPEG